MIIDYDEPSSYLLLFIRALEKHYKSLGKLCPSIHCQGPRHKRGRGRFGQNIFAGDDQKNSKAGAFIQFAENMTNLHKILDFLSLYIHMCMYYR